MTDMTQLAHASHGRTHAGPGDGGARCSAGSLTWMSRGACQAEDPELFFPIAAQGPAISQIRAARAVCQRCAVAALCLAYALQTSQAGIWGGTTEEERRAMTGRHRQTPAAPGVLKPG